MVFYENYHRLTKVYHFCYNLHMKEISVLGITMTDYSLREALRAAEEFLESGPLNTMCFLNKELLMKAKDDVSLRNAVQSMDVLLVGNTDILLAGGIATGSRKKEVKENFLMRELLKRLAKEKRKIFLLGESDQALVELRTKLLDIDSGLTFFGSFAFDGPEVSELAIINEINSVVPDVIISLLPSPKQELLMSRNAGMINARLWLSLQQEVLEVKKGQGIGRSFILDFIDRYIFKKTVERFDDN